MNPPSSPPPSNPARERLIAALEMHDEGVALMRQNLRRRWPEADSEEINQRLQSWLLERKGSELGDAPQPRPGR